MFISLSNKIQAFKLSLEVQIHDRFYICEGDFSRKILKTSAANHRLYTGQNQGRVSEKNSRLKELEEP